MRTFGVQGTQCRHQAQDVSRTIGVELARNLADQLILKARKHVLLKRTAVIACKQGRVQLLPYEQLAGNDGYQWGIAGDGNQLGEAWSSLRPHDFNGERLYILVGHRPNRGEFQNLLAVEASE